tara:strand:- start:4451 stop:4864 length:414 start_codon:yes stop_codon:yes gene_type:complete
MIREIIILFLFILTISGVFVQNLIVLLPKRIDTKDLGDSYNTKNIDINTIIDQENEASNSLLISDWGKDIFYDRSNIYNSWFNLTGITEFENGYKAIVNGNIVSEYNRVRGFTVKDVTKNKVILERNQYRVTLKLEK